MLAQKYKVLRLRTSEDNPCCHEIFMKEHFADTYDKDKPEGRTLFLLNVPPYIERHGLSKIFVTFGQLESVSCYKDKDSHSFNVAYVVFKTSESVESALCHDDIVTLSKCDFSYCGIEKWVRNYNNSILDHKILQNKVDTFMSKYDKNEAKNKVIEQKIGKVDEDGWTTVTKGSRKPGLPRKESVGRKIAEKSSKKSKKKQLKHFYSFQIKESKINHIVQLREKFEEDKKRIAAMKESRKFKPF